MFVAADDAVVTLDRRTGRERWTAELPEGIYRRPAVVGDRVVTVDGGQGGGDLYAPDAASGDELWKNRIPLTVDAQITGSFTVSGVRCT